MKFFSVGGRVKGVVVIERVGDLKANCNGWLIETSRGEGRSYVPCPGFHAKETTVTQAREGGELGRA